MAKNKIAITPKEYQEKRFEAAVALLGSTIGNLGKFNAIGEDKNLDSLVHNCIYLADTLVKELGYQSSDPDSATIVKLKDIMEED